MVYSITKELSGPKNIYNKLVQDKLGKRLTTDREQAERWAQHFKLKYKWQSRK